MLDSAVPSLHSWRCTQDPRDGQDIVGGLVESHEDPLVCSWGGAARNLGGPHCFPEICCCVHRHPGGVFLNERGTPFEGHRGSRLPECGVEVFPEVFQVFNSNTHT